MKFTTIGVAAALLLLSVSAQAQQSTTPSTAATVQDILAFLVTNQGVQTSDFDKDREAAEATRSTLTRALLTSMARVPLGTSSGGFTYRLNPALGTVERASETFGPFYVERALTSGAGQASFGFTFQYASYQSLDGHNLKDGQFVTIANQFRDEAAPFDVETLALDVTTRTATFYGNVGLTDRVDVGVAVPVVQLDIRGTRSNTYRGQTLLQARASAETLGLADIAVRSKVRVFGDGPGGIAAGVEVRLPTGREEDLLGSGDAALRLQGLASAESGPTSVHVNLTVGTGGLGREVSYGGAVAVAATRQLTLVGEVLARHIDGMQRIAEVIAPHPRISGVNTLRLIPSGDDATSAFAVAGFKWNVGGTWLVHGNVLFPVTESGLTAKITPSIALDYSFTR